jgi:exodeoxyribonuclease V alpha subunit
MVNPLGRGRRPEDAPAWLPALADALVEALPRLRQEKSEPRLAELIRALTAALARGETELALTGPPPPEVDPGLWPEGHRTALIGSSLAMAPDGPLVLDDGRVLWRRWWERRQAVLESLIRRAREIPADEQPETLAEAPPATSAGPELDPDQHRALEAVRRHRLVLLQGGPGTGKTSTVGRMLTDLEGWGRESRVHLAAPTG